MALPVLVTQTVIDHLSFVLYWKDYYSESYNHTYVEVIDKPEWVDSDIYRLFGWKNNMKGKLGKTKEVFVSKVVNQLDLVNRLRIDFNKDKFDVAFKHLGPIWTITLLHAMQPYQYPIFDQHVYRAYCYLSTKVKDAILKRNEAYDIYYTDYLRFFRNFSVKAEGVKLKEIDNALWAFGRFLSLYPKMISL